MKLLVPRVTDATTKKDLRECAHRVLEAWLHLLFSGRPESISCRIVPIRDSMGTKQRHGFLDVTPDDAAVKLIRKLSGAFLRAKRVGVDWNDEPSARAIVRH